MGVLIDDLVTRGTREPYRMFTSRAEYRLLLREDNADQRLMEIGAAYGLVPPSAVERMRDRRRRITGEIARIKGTVVAPTPEINADLAARGTAALTSGMHLDKLLRRVELDYATVRRWAPPPEELPEDLARQVAVEIKYEGYIQRQLREIERFRDLENIRLPETLDFEAVHGLSNELKEKLARVRPETLGQASRIEGMTPAALGVLMIALKAGRIQNP